MAISNAVNLANFTSGDTFTVDTTNDRVGIGSTTPTRELDVAGNVTATSYYGDGSNLSGITAGATLSAGSGAQRIVVTSLTSGTMTAAATDAELTYNSSTDTLSATNVSATDVSATDVTATTGSFTTVSIAGTITYEDVTNVDSVGVVTARSGIEIGAAGVGGTITADGHAEFAGVVTATSYRGDGSNLTGISAGINTTSSSPSANTIVTLNLGSAQHHELTLTAGVTTVTCSGGNFGESHSVVLIQPTSGTTTVGFSTYFLFPSGSTPSMSAGGGKVDLISFVVKQAGAGGTELLASAGLNYQ